MKYIYVIISILCICSENNSVYSTQQRNGDNTDLAKEPDDRPLLFATLGGGMVALDQMSGKIIWSLKDEPVVKVPNENDHFVPQFLPDPRHGSLYMFGTHSGDRQVLKKLPFTIPQLVANAPCRSSDGIFYTGKKIDTWFMIDRKTGIRKPILGFDKSHPFESSKTNTCPIDPKNAIYVARTEYNVLMYDSKNQNQRWNVTFFDYSSHTMGQEMSSNYGVVHFTSTSSGRVTSFNRKTGEMLWSHDMQSPIIAAYLLDREGLISVPFNAIGDDTMDHIMEDVSTLRDGQAFKHSNIELFPSLYIGEHVHGLYALSSLVDKNTITIATEGSQPLLLEGPDNTGNKNEYQLQGKNKYSPIYRKYVNVHYNVKNNENAEMSQVYMLLGHYSMPDYADADLRIVSRSNEIAFPVNVMNNDLNKNSQVKLIMGPSDDSKDRNWYEIQNETEPKNKNDEAVVITNYSDKEDDKSKVSVGIQTDYETDKHGGSLKLKLIYQNASVWINQQENKGLKFVLIIMTGVVITMAWYLRNRMREFQHLSQSGSRSSNSSSYNGKVTALPEELDDGSIKIGKIIFNPENVLGKGCEGTFVYRGTFENRDVAVKRLLPECFTFADREVALLTESDAHANVVRYFCMEQDRLFRYIALELCAVTLEEYVKNKLEIDYKISPLEVLQQATDGLAHLHSLDIVHRDIKPHNVLLSVPSNKSPVRAMISDFGLCKKLNIGRNSFSRRSGVTGTDGWIAPEMIKGERTTTSVDIFSLGCVFHYVLSKGTHPFGDVLERQAKILKGYYKISDLNLTMPEEEVDLTRCLLTSMLSSRPSDRPPANVVGAYPLFWNKQKVLTFFQDVSDRVEKDAPGGPLEAGAACVVRGDWRGRVGPDVAADLRRYRSYSGDSVRDLLRALRNKKHHYRELTTEAQTSLGSIPEGFTMYWLSRFPRLLLHTWLQMQLFKQEDILSLYYDHAYEFNSNFIANDIEFQDLKRYDTDRKIETNNLFIKSRHFFDPSQPKTKYKNDVLYKYDNAVDDWRAGPRNEDNNDNEDHFEDKDPLRYSPVKNSPGRDTNRYKYDDKRDKRKSPKHQQYNYANNRDKLNCVQNNDATTSRDNANITAEVIKVRNRRKKEDAPIVWILPNQAVGEDGNPGNTFN